MTTTDKGEKTVPWLIVGGDSEIGSALLEHLLNDGRHVAATTRRPALRGPARPYVDLAAPAETWELPEGLESACITAAVARLAACAADPAASTAINVTGTVSLVEKLAASGTHTVFLSTNQVFDGSIPDVPAESATCPVSEYGRQKAQTEFALQALIRRGAPVAILRLAKVLAPEMPLLRSWTRALTRGVAVRAFHDMTMAPIPSNLVIQTITCLMRDRACGVFQLTGPIDASYAEIARFLARRIGVEESLVQESSADCAGLPTGSTPQHTTLDSSRLRALYGLAVPEIWQVLEGLPIFSDASGPSSS